MHPLKNTSAAHTVLVIKDILMLMNLKIGHCYDKASEMAGSTSRAAAQLKILNGKFIFSS